MMKVADIHKGCLQTKIKECNKQYKKKEEIYTDFY